VRRAAVGPGAAKGLDRAERLAAEGDLGFDVAADESGDDG
jgi:hypothetical protein